MGSWRYGIKVLLQGGVEGKRHMEEGVLGVYPLFVLLVFLRLNVRALMKNSKVFDI